MKTFEELEKICQDTWMSGHKYLKMTPIELWQASMRDGCLITNPNGKWEDNKRKDIVHITSNGETVSRGLVDMMWDHWLSYKDGFIDAYKLLEK